MRTTKRLLPLAAGCLLLALAACTPLPSARTETPNVFALDVRLPEKPAAAGGSLTLLVSQPRARPGFDGQHMIYVRQPHELEYFARSQWVAPPGRMLAPLLVQALERSARFRAVLQAPGSVAADLRLDTEIIRLQQEFFSRPSRVHLTVRAQLIDTAARKVLATKEFDMLQDAPTDDAYGGVIAANRAVELLLAQISEFCRNSAGQ